MTVTTSKAESAGWGSIFLVYCYGLLAIASAGKMAPIAADMGKALGSSPQEIGWIIGLLFIAPTLGSTLGGSAVDRYGARPMLAGACVLIVIANAICYISDSLGLIEAARLIEGIGFVAITAAAPSLLIMTTSGKRQTGAMALWSTYFAAGISAGLLLAAPFSATEHWRLPFVIHGAAAAVLALSVGLLPVPGQTSRGTAGNDDALRAVIGESGVLRLAAAFAILTIAGFGVNIVMPQYMAKTLGVSVSMGSAAVAISNIASICGGILTGFLLSRGHSFKLVAATISVLACMASISLFLPQSSVTLTIVSLMVWGFATPGTMVAVVMIMIPRVLKNTAIVGLANGVVVQSGSAAAFFVPAIYFSLLANGIWWYFALLGLACVIFALITLLTIQPTGGMIDDGANIH